MAAYILSVILDDDGTIVLNGTDRASQWCAEHETWLRITSGKKNDFNHVQDFISASDFSEVKPHVVTFGDF